MTLDFTKLGPAGSSKQREPRKLFTVLTKHSRFRRPSDEQGDVLDHWYRERERIDNTIKMNTGSGKTLVGLLALQSSLNDNVKPAVYITPDNYLVDQVLKEAKDLGIEATDDINSPDFASGRSILVINIMKLINGKSAFGVNETKIRIGALVVDDAHACLETVSAQFSLTLKNSHPLYKELFSLFKEALSDQSRFEFLSVEAEDPTAMVQVPFWAWSGKYNEVTQLLHKYRYDEQVVFAFPLINSVIRQCRCVIGGKALEIAPRNLPISVIPAFARAQRRIYMTATLADDGILVSHFNADPVSVSDPIRPKGGGDMGDRMILVPQEINPKITTQEIKHLAAHISRVRNVVVIVPSFRASEFWKDVAAKVLDRTNIAAGVEKLKAGHVGLVVLVNKYDGIDLPDGACRLLIIDGLPEVYGLIERTEMARLEGTDIEITRQVQRIEQGMGRGVRSSEDHCVVLLLGSKLSRRIHSQKARETFNASTLAQLELGAAVTQQLRGKPLSDLIPILDLCFNQNSDWRAASRNAIVNATEPQSCAIDPVTVLARRAFDLGGQGNFPEASKMLQEAVKSSKDDLLKGYYQELLAEYVHEFDPPRAQEVLLSALKLNSHVLKPIAGVRYAKLTSPAGTQAAAAVEYMRQYSSENDFILSVNALIEDLAWSEDGTKAFELAIFELGRLLGFGSQRPELDTNGGPDNLWSLGNLSYLVIECKSGATSAAISKSDCDQISGAINWFKAKYDQTASAAPIIVHPSFNVDKMASPPDVLRVLDREHLSLLRASVLEYSANISSSAGMRDREFVQKQLQHFSLSPNGFVSKFTRPFIKR